MATTVPVVVVTAGAVGSGAGGGAGAGAGSTPGSPPVVVSTASLHDAMLAAGEEMPSLEGTTITSDGGSIMSHSGVSAADGGAGAAGAGAAEGTSSPTAAERAAAAMSTASPPPGPGEAGFEGPEKNLEVDFVPRPSVEGDRGCRDIPREQWDAICKEARCTILCSSSNAKFDSYVLSESSLFVYPYKVVMKTCGTTTLLHAMKPLLAAATVLGLEVEWVGYTRKNFMFPAEQVFPHSNFQHEVDWLRRHFPDGHAYVLGPITDDHWFIFVADYCERPPEEETDRTLDIMMYDLDPDCSRMFWKGPDFTTARDVTIKSGIRDLMPHARIQEFQFEPCGYSMNALLFDAYFTIHITPESHCSYASFETNVRQKAYGPLIRNVLSVFRPKRFTLTLFSDRGGLKEMQSNPVEAAEYTARAGTYVQTSQSGTAFAGDYCSFMGNYKLGASKATTKMSADARRPRNLSVDGSIS